MKKSNERILIYGLGAVALIAAATGMQTSIGYKSELNNSSRLANQLRTDRDAHLYTASGYKSNLNKSSELVSQLTSERDMYKTYLQEVWTVKEQLWRHGAFATMTNIGGNGERFRQSYLDKYGYSVVSPNTGNTQIQATPRWHQEYRNAL
jgi:hypothetical protein